MCVNRTKIGQNTHQKQIKGNSPLGSAVCSHSTPQNASSQSHPSSLPLPKLDTIRSSMETLVNKGIPHLQKKAKRQAYGQAIKLRLITVNSPLLPKVIASLECGKTIIVHGKDSFQWRCRRSWCPDCCAQKTAKLSDRYGDHIKALKDPHMVTLTAKTFEAHSSAAISSRIRELSSMWGRSKDAMRKQGMKLTALRKLEGHQAKDGKFNFHFHVIVEGAEHSYELQRQWLIQAAKKGIDAVIEAQDVRQVDDGAIMEVFKYAVKMITKHADDDVRGINPKATMRIFEALHGKRTISTCGKLYGLKIEEIEDEKEGFVTEEIEPDHSRDGNYIHVRSLNDWVNEDTGETLSGFVPDKTFKRLVNLCCTSDQEQVAQERLKKWSKYQDGITRWSKGVVFKSIAERQGDGTPLPYEHSIVISKTKIPCYKTRIQKNTQTSLNFGNGCSS